MKQKPKSKSVVIPANATKQEREIRNIQIVKEDQNYFCLQIT